MIEDRPFLSPAAIAWVACFLAVLAWSFVTSDRFTWFLEVVPALLGIVLLALTRRRFPLTPLLYWLILAHSIILMAGGKYTYAKVPAGFWFQDLFRLARNPYDRLGHFVQGFVPAILTREILIRRGVVKGRGWLFFIVTSICLAFSACYELIEWRTAVGTGEKADAFLGTQGDTWDTQWDMATALIGALAAQLALSRWHDRQLRDRSS